MKTKKAVVKRLKETASGKLKYKHTKLRHHLSHQETGNKRKHKLPNYIKTPDMKRITKCLA
jgi:ribosomal protein L35